jgi:hypothetical protein
MLEEFTTMRLLMITTCVATLIAMQSVASAEIVVASEDFDGGDLNLVSSSVPTLDGGGGDTFAVGSTQTWPTTGGVPFSLADNSVGAVGGSTAFPGDTEGVYGVNSNFNNNFLGISDTQEWTGGEPTASWVFDIAGAEQLGLSIGMGSMEGSNFAYDANTELLFSVSIDGGPSQTAFLVQADPAGDGYSYRPMDDGTVVVADDNALSVSGDALVEKLLAEDGSIGGNLFLDKTPGSGAGAGQLDTFRTSINGTGNQLTLTLTANLPFEGAAIDNISITAIPEPSSFALLAVGLTTVGLRRRRR